MFVLICIQQGLCVEEELNFGPFGVDCSHGEIPPNSTMEIKLSFIPDGIQSYFETLFIHVPKAEDSLKLDITGESSVPMVETLDKDSIFRNVHLTHQATQLSLLRKEYNFSQNKLSFGTVLASTGKSNLQVKYIHDVFNPC